MNFREASSIIWKKSGIPYLLALITTVIIVRKPSHFRFADTQLMYEGEFRLKQLAVFIALIKIFGG